VSRVDLGVVAQAERGQTQLGPVARGKGLVKGGEEGVECSAWLHTEAMSPSLRAQQHCLSLFFGRKMVTLNGHRLKLGEALTSNLFSSQILRTTISIESLHYILKHQKHSCAYCWCKSQQAMRKANRGLNEKIAA